MAGAELAELLERLAEREEVRLLFACANRSDKDVSETTAEAEVRLR